MKLFDALNVKGFVEEVVQPVVFELGAGEPQGNANTSHEVATPSLTHDRVAALAVLHYSQQWTHHQRGIPFSLNSLNGIIIKGECDTDFLFTPKIPEN